MESKVFDPSLMENRFRHEFKYLSTLGQLKTIQVRLKSFASGSTITATAGSRWN